MESTATAEQHDWTKARLRPDSSQNEERPDKNLFAGSIAVSEAVIAGIPVLRIAVSPELDGVAPASYAITGDTAKWSAVSSLDCPVQWQQSKEARWDFYFNLPEDIVCLGLGERFSGNNLRGIVHTLVSTDQPHHNEGADALYKAIPFLILQEIDGLTCHGLFLDSPAPQMWDLDSSLAGSGHIKLFSRRGWTLYVFGSGTLAQQVEAFTQLTGRASVPPLWALGHQQCRWSYPDRDTAMNIASEFRQRQLACDTIVLDIDYMDEYRVFTNSPKRFPSLSQLSEDMKDLDLNVITIVDPGIKKDPKYPIYKEAIAQDLICLTPDGKPFTEEVWPGTCVFPDFLQEKTRKWWGDNLRFYTDNGIAGIWNDMNEPAFFLDRRPLPAGMEQLPPETEQRFVHRTPEGIVGHLEVRNLYGLLMSRATAEGLTRLRPHERPFVLTRSAYAGIQKYSAVWLGDNMSWFEHLKKSIPMLINMGLSGASFAGVDIGGFGGDCPAELLVRWYETGIFYPFFRNHCRMQDRAQEPWAYGAKVENLVGKLIQTRYRLLPYIYALFYEHARTGAPLMRPLTWHYPQDKLAREIDDQFMFGRDILVAPIVDRARTFRHVYLPDGRWYPIEGGEALTGGSVHAIDMPLGTVPAFVREGAILPLCARELQNTQEYPEAPVVFAVFGDTASGIYVEDDYVSDAYADGKYNMYHLEYADGALTATAVHANYPDAPRRQFFIERDGQRRPTSL
jgi:alpha-glucosidase